MTEANPTVLLVDQIPSSAHALSRHLWGAGYSVATATDGDTAWEMLETEPERFDAAILDCTASDVGGFEMRDRIGLHPVLQGLPVILQTELGQEQEILAQLKSGSFYCLIKPYDEDMLLSVLATALTDRVDQLRRLECGDQVSLASGLMGEASFGFKSVRCARDLGAVLAEICPEPRRVIVGLTELLINAVEHGNLGIGYEEKSRLQREGRWGEVVEARLADPMHASKEVLVRVFRESDRIRILIQDEGNGFDWARFLEIDPQRETDFHGRGIAIARAISFDSIEYRGCGNEVEAVVNLG